MLGGIRGDAVRVRSVSREERGVPVLHGEREVVCVSRTKGVALSTPWGGGFLVRARPVRVETRRAGVLQSRDPIPDWGGRASLVATLIVAIGVLLGFQRRRGR